MKKKCNLNCEYINMIPHSNKVECLAQKNAPYVEFGDECTVHNEYELMQSFFESDPERLREFEEWKDENSWMNESNFESAWKKYKPPKINDSCDVVWYKQIARDWIKWHNKHPDVVLS